MDGWIIIFILLCVFYGPIYVTLALFGGALTFAPGTANDVPIGPFIFLLILLGAPFIFFGYMAFFHRKMD